MEAFFREDTKANAMPVQDPELRRAHVMELLGPPLAVEQRRQIGNRDAPKCGAEPAADGTAEKCYFAARRNVLLFQVPA